MPLSWVYPREKIEHFWYEPEYWESVVRTLERGCFDMLFFADGLAGGSTPDQIRYAIQFPCHDPVALVTYLSAVAKRLGFAVTMSTTFYPPYLLARTLATLDHLTKGRIGWNIVSSISTAEARNFGYDEIPDHDRRYDLADEYMELCHALWNSWEDDALVMDTERQIFADPDKVHRVDFKGQRYRAQGPFTVVPSPRRRPFLFQAGQSERGKSFAARHAEGIFSAAREPSRCAPSWRTSRRGSKGPERIRPPSRFCGRASRSSRKASTKRGIATTRSAIAFRWKPHSRRCRCILIWTAPRSISTSPLRISKWAAPEASLRCIRRRIPPRPFARSPRPT